MQQLAARWTRNNAIFASGEACWSTEGTSVARRSAPASAAAVAFPGNVTASIAERLRRGP
jgi:hypothetical protein